MTVRAVPSSVRSDDHFLRFTKQLLPFPLTVASIGDKVRKAFGVPKAAFGLLPGRVTYVLDKDGVCQKVYDDLADAVSHVEVAKSALKELKSSKAAAKPLFRL